MGVSGAADLLAGSAEGEMVISRWGQGNLFTGSNPSSEGLFVQGPLPGTGVDKVLLDLNGRIVSRPKPQYEDFAAHQFVSVRSKGAVGDGETVSRSYDQLQVADTKWPQDDTFAFQATLDKVNPTVLHLMVE